MKVANSLPQKILTLKELQFRVAQWRLPGKTVAFTNGCFDILHAGHIASLSEASEQANYLIVAVNADSSVKKLKGEHRPINSQDSRALLLASLCMVDAVVIFDEETPLELIRNLLPDVLVKGGDYKVEDIVGAKEVIAAGGKVIINPIKEGFSSTNIINRLNNAI
ncbi:MAG: D-beta-D-heptose 1-phosphate adenosyltransferase [Flaviaesturariibacter sp.]|nr:D-beta-D-heptose 1-phosphate adenosyltransferase [Flaviaesturariibacter sp.]